MKRRRSAPVVFRLRPDEDRTLYVLVKVWPTRAAMHERLREMGRDAAGVEGYCLEMLAHRLYRGRWRRTPLVAEVNLYHSRIGTEVVTHELLHAAIAYSRRCKVWMGTLSDEDTTSCTPEEEFLCHAHGTLVRQFVNKAYAAGLYEAGKQYA